MKPAAFDYLRPETIKEAVVALAEYGQDARILAGGQSLLPMLNMRLSRPCAVIDISRLEGLGNISKSKGIITIGAQVTQSIVLSKLLDIKLLAKALPWVGHAQTRARGTFCGSIAHADPSAEIPLCMLLLEGVLHLRSSRKSRKVKIADFITGMMSTDCKDDELVEAVSFPIPKSDEGFGFAEFGRRHGDFAITACAAKVTKSEIILAVGGVADMATMRRFPRLEGDALDEALNKFAWELGARDDVHADARLRRDLVRSLGRKSIEEAS